MKVHLPEIVELRADDGSNISVDLSKVKMDEKQRAALSSVYSKSAVEGRYQQISEEEFELISDLRSQIELGPDVAFIVRFDWKWVRIDEPKKTFGEFQRDLGRGE